MVLSEQSRRLSEPLAWSHRERTIVAVLACGVVLALLGLGVFALTSGAPARADCIAVTFPSTLGGAELRGCGGQARRICASGDFRGIESQLADACRHARMPYRRPA
jgi:hypothetical protein